MSTTRASFECGLMKCLVFVASCILTGCSDMPVQSPATVLTPATLRTCAVDARTSDCPPPSPREFRAVWIATVANIDWPTKPGLPVATQKAEVISILNRVQALNMNAVLLQVRPAADAIYPSKLEPWAEWLSGEQGRSPEPAYDPLGFWIDEARKRGIELHAWFNPYRARHTKALSPVSKDHIAQRAPAAVKSYGGFLWLDPGEKAAQDHSFAVIMDVLRRYDIDGVHFDDYFYPYPVVEQAATQQPGAAANAVANALNPPSPSIVNRTPERELDFPDEPSWRAYLASGGKLSRADWRRDNVNRFVERIYKSVKAEKPWVRFGISPFGIGRPDRRPPGIAGFSQYDKLYADVELWLERGWLDYLAPQLYWAIDQTPQAFGTLLDYWHAQNTLKRDIFPGLYTSRIDDTPNAWTPLEIERQIAMLRTKRNALAAQREPAQVRREPAQGHIHFSMAPIAQNRRNIADSLSKQYGSSALPRSAPLNGDAKKFSVDIELSIENDTAQGYLGINVKSLLIDSMLSSVALHLRYGSEWQFAALPVTITSGAIALQTTVPAANARGPLTAVAVSLVDRYGRESDRAVRELSRVGVASP
jgi:uncharacterized lipoprotein YddW (UPF0748 family)